MNRNGQVFSLDILISIVLIVAAVGVAMRFFELKEYETREALDQMELYRAGNTAVELLVNNPDIVCQLKDVARGTKLSQLSNCISRNETISKKDIGLNNVPVAYGYACEIKIGDEIMALASGECQDALSPNVKNVFAATREVVITDSQDVPKKEFNYCTDSDAATACTIFTEGRITIKVWKIPEN